MTVLNWLCRIYSLLVRAYPTDFRERYAEEMARVFRDRGREIAQSGGTWGLLGYALSIGRDWFVTVLRERMDSMQMPSLPMLRWAFLFCVALDLVLLRATYDTRLPFALLIMFGILVSFVTTNVDDVRRVVLQIGSGWGLISGVILTAGTNANYFIQSEGLVLSALVLVFACWSIAGYLTSRRTAIASSGCVAGCWSGVVCVLIDATCSLLIQRMSPPSPNFVHFLPAGGQHLMQGPVIGAVLGAVAGLSARIVDKWQSSPPAVGLAGGE